MSKGTIIYIGGFELPDRNAAAQRVVANAKILKSLDFKVILVGVDKSLNNNKNFINSKKIYEDLTYYCSKYPSSLSDWISYLFGIKSIKNLKHLNPKIIIAYNYPGFAFLNLLIYCKKKNIKLIGDCTEWYEPKGNFIFIFIKSIDVFFRMKIVQPKIDGLIVISDYLMNFYKDKNKNILNIPPLVDLKMDKWKNDINDNSDCFTFIYAGSPGNGNKDRIDNIIHVLSKIKIANNFSFKLKILGLTKEEYIIVFGLNKTPINIHEFVVFKGKIPHEEVLSEISSAQFVIFIRDNNLTNTAGFPTKFVEAISCGTPVITNLSSDIKKYFINNKTGVLLDSLSYDYLESKLIDILSLEKDKINEMKEYCKNSYMFDIEKYISVFDAFINKIDISKKKLIRITTIPISLEKLLENQLHFMKQYYAVTAISSDKINLERLGNLQDVAVFHTEMTRKISPFQDLRAVWNLYKYFKKEKPFIVHTHTPKAGTVGMIAARLAGVPHRLHTIAGLPLLEATGNKRKLLNFVEKITYSCATFIYPNSYGLKDIIIKEQFCLPKKLKVIGNGSSNGINTSFFDPALFSDEENQILKKTLGIAPDDFVFIFIGRLVGDKGINELMQAFKRISSEVIHIKLLLVGSLESDLDPLHPETLNEIASNKDIISLGFQNDVRPSLSISDVLVFPSYREGFPNVVLQAGAMGLPSIVSNINGCNEIILEGKNGIIIPVKNSHAIYESMLKLMNEKELCNQLQSNARKMIINRYDQQVVWNAILAEYKSLE